jgi:PTS system N-acetylglucosamine-specific IIC component
MYHAALPDKRRAVAGLLGSMALTSFLTGVTEPIEFSFMFLAPALYVMHALLTGGAMVLMHVLNVHLGFSFSAGLFDYVLNFSLATNPWMLLPIGLVYFGLYYAAFRFVIQRFNLKTPGREMDDALLADQPGPVGDADRAQAFIKALGGAQNLVSVDACTTRLRLVVADQNAVNVDYLKQLGARGVVRPSANALQVVLGPIADQVAGDIRAGMHSRGAEPASTDARPFSPEEEPAKPGPVPAAAAAASAPFDSGLANQLLFALGGRENIRELGAISTRLRVTVRDMGSISESALQALGLRGVAHPTPDTLHLVIGPNARSAYAALQAIRSLSE